MSNNENVSGDLNDLLSIVNDGKEGYESAMDATENPELKALFSRLMGERIVYAAELKEHISVHGGEAENEHGGILGGLHRTWLTIKQALSSKEDQAILGAIVTGERAAIEKYDGYIENYARHADHLSLLTGQREGIKAALSEIEILQVRYNRDEEEPISSVPVEERFDESANTAANYGGTVNEAEQMGSEGLVSPGPFGSEKDIRDQEKL